MIAGHEFQYTSQGRRCIRALPNGEICNAVWRHVRTAGLGDVGSPGFAHTGNLTLSEQADIAAAAKAEDDAVWEAVVYAASAGSR